MTFITFERLETDTVVHSTRMVLSNPALYSFTIVLAFVLSTSEGICNFKCCENIIIIISKRYNTMIQLSLSELDNLKNLIVISVSSFFCYDCVSFIDQDCYTNPAQHKFKSNCIYPRIDPTEHDSLIADILNYEDNESKSINRILFLNIYFPSQLHPILNIVRIVLIACSHIFQLTRTGLLITTVVFSS